MKLSIHRYLTIALTVLILAPTVLAASFDCAKAKSQVEKLICSDENLGALDTELAAIYKANMQQLSPAAAKSLQSDQRTWIINTQKSLNKYRKNLAEYKLDIVQAETDSLSDDYNTRIATLKKQRKILDGFIVYHLKNRELIDADKVSDKQKKTALALNTWINSEYKKYTKDEQLANSEWEIHFTESNFLPQIITAKFEGEEARGLGQHIYSIDRSMFFLLTELRPLKISDVFSGKNWQEEVAHQIEKKLNADINKYKQQHKKEEWASNLDAAQIKLNEIKERLLDMSNWEMNANNFSLHTIDIGETSWGDYGIDTIEIPWQSLKPWLAPQFKYKV